MSGFPDQSILTLQESELLRMSDKKTSRLMGKQDHLFSQGTEHNCFVVHP